MNKDKNDFTDDINALFAKCVDLDHLLVFVPWLHKMAEPTVKNSRAILRKMGMKEDEFGPGTAVGAINIFHQGHWIRRAPTGKRITAGQDVLLMAEEVEGRMNSSILCVLHELWESYVKKVYGKLLWHLDKSVPLPSRATFHKKIANWRNYKDTPNYFADYAAFACKRDCSEAIGLFRKELDWAIVHVRNWPRENMEWLDVARVLALCRNSIVHDEGHVSDARIVRLNKQLRDFVKSQMHKTILSNDPRIMPDARSVEELIEAIMSLAYGIYVLVSMRCGLKVEFDPFGSVR